MEPTDFYDVHKWQNGYYRRIETGTISRTHIFEVLQENESTTLSLKDDRDCEPVTQDLLPKTNRGNASVLSAEDREKAIRSMYDDLKKPANGFILEAPGLRPIKQVEMHKKWGPLVPLYIRNFYWLYKKPPDEIIKQVKDDKNKTNRKRKATAKLKENTKKNSKSSDEESEAEEEVSAAAAAAASAVD